MKRFTCSNCSKVYDEAKLRKWLEDYHRSRLSDVDKSMLKEYMTPLNGTEVLDYQKIDKENPELSRRLYVNEMSWERLDMLEEGSVVYNIESVVKSSPCPNCNSKSSVVSTKSSS